MKKSLSVILCIALIVAAIPFGTVLAMKEYDSGGITGDCEWSLSGTELTVDGKGSMGDYTSASAPWGTSITKVTINHGVVGIGKNCFKDCSALADIYYIGSEAQWNMIPKTDAGIPGTTTIHYYDCASSGHIFEKGICIICNYAEGGSATVGDLDGDGNLTDADAVHLLMHVYFPTVYPISQNADYDKDGYITDADAVYLLMHLYFPAIYPIE